MSILKSYDTDPYKSVTFLPAELGSNVYPLQLSAVIDDDDHALLLFHQLRSSSIPSCTRFI